MIVNNDLQNGVYEGEKTALKYLKKYENAKSQRENFLPLFEECYEYALPQRESFYAESVGQRRDDKIFDETAVVGVQEFASRLQSGLFLILLDGRILLRGLKFRLKKKMKSIISLMKSQIMSLRLYKIQTLFRKFTNRLWTWR